MDTLVDHVLSVSTPPFSLPVPYFLRQSHLQDLFPLYDILHRLPLTCHVLPVPLLRPVAPTLHRGSPQTKDPEVGLATRHPLLDLSRNPPPLPLPGCLDHATIVPASLHPLDPVIDRAHPQSVCPVLLLFRPFRPIPSLTGSHVLVPTDPLRTVRWSGRGVHRHVLDARTIVAGEYVLTSFRGVQAVTVTAFPGTGAISASSSVAPSCNVRHDRGGLVYAEVFGVPGGRKGDSRATVALLRYPIAMSLAATRSVEQVMRSQGLLVDHVLVERHLVGKKAQTVPLFPRFCPLAFTPLNYPFLWGPRLSPTTPARFFPPKRSSSASRVSSVADVRMLLSFCAGKSCHGLVRHVQIPNCHSVEHHLTPFQHFAFVLFIICILFYSTCGEEWCFEAVSGRDVTYESPWSTIIPNRDGL
ncbi:hypothetical protein WN48_02136 [Eufriesea mexicana]|uniref:Uncharacterized protein n=1 Tax=Eufriesea mexicana TaxID=516756 RepID=A0A310SC94_9HYME|nr:hypothetical protein WN48_02136 [Eufriesea mexicana]